MPLTLTEAFVAIAAQNFSNLVQFYHDLLDLAPSQTIPNRYAEFHLPGLRLGIFHPKQVPSRDSPAQQLSLCLEVADLDAAIAHLTQLGYPPPGEIITASHGREIYAYDPDGNWLILHQGNA